MSQVHSSRVSGWERSQPGIGRAGSTRPASTLSAEFICKKRTKRSRNVARTVSALTRQKITDPTSGFQALNRKAITLFAADYPHDYPEVEALVMLIRHRLRLKEVPVAMRPRAAGRSSIRALSSVYYMVKVLLALFVGSFRRNVVPLEEK